MKKETVDTQPNSTHMNQVGSMGLTIFFFLIIIIIQLNIRITPPQIKANL